jgi:hypothetical protein
MAVDQGIGPGEVSKSREIIAGNAGVFAQLEKVIGGKAFLHGDRKWRRQIARRTKQDGRGSDRRLRSCSLGLLRTYSHGSLSRKASEGLIAYDSVACTFGYLCNKIFDQQPPSLTKWILLWRPPSGNQSTKSVTHDEKKS